MKIASMFLATTLSLFFGLHLSLNAQKTATWKGGTPGRCTDWNCASNWKEGLVPNEFSDVVIPVLATSTFCYPVIEAENYEVASLVVHPGAALKVLGSALLATNTYEIQGNCKGCAPRVFVKEGFPDPNLKLLIQSQSIARN